MFENRRTFAILPSLTAVLRARVLQAGVGEQVEALLGVSLVITRGKPASLLHGEGHGGELMVLLGCVCWIAYTLAARRFPTFSPLRYTALSAGYGTLTILAVTAIVALTGGTHFTSVSAIWWQTLYIVFAGGVVAVLAWNDGVRRIGAANGALFLNLVPVVSFAIAITIQGYHPNGWELLGAAVTIAALLAGNLASRARATGPAPARRARLRPSGAPARAGRSA